MTLSDVASHVPTVGLFLAAAGIFLNGWKFARTRRATTLQHIQDFLKATNERETALADAQGDEKTRHAFVEYLNFLEIYAAAENAGLFVGVAREIVVDKLIDAVVVLEGVPEWHSHISASITSVVTFKYLVRFMQRPGRTISTRRTAASSTEASLKIQTLD